MRVITGTARGKRLKELKGEDTRPTTDRVKESLFNIIQFEVPGRQVLDLFAGTGQLGIECLSRGAAGVTFVDVRKDASALIRENLALCGFPGSATTASPLPAPLPQVVQQESISFLATCPKESYDVILLDPPYQSPFLEKSLSSIVGFDILRNHGIIVCESPVEKVLPPLAPPYVLGKEYRYGKIKLTTILKNP